MFWDWSARELRTARLDGTDTTASVKLGESRHEVRGAIVTLELIRLSTG
jgi:hypothetical protein